MAEIYSRKGVCYGTADDMIDHIEALEARIAKADALAEALSFYASATVEYPSGKVTFQPGDDNGQRAKAALAAYREGTDT